MNNQNMAPNETEKNDLTENLKKKNRILIGLCAFLSVCLLILVVVVLRGGSNKKNDILEGNTGLGDASGVEDVPAVEEAILTLSDKPEDYTFELQGIVYQLPTSYEAFSANGWEPYHSGEDLKRVPGLGTSYCFMKNGDAEISLSIYNNQISARAMRECGVYAIDIKDSESLSFRLAKGVTLDSNQDAIISAFGEPESMYEFDDSIHITYDFDKENFRESMSISLDQENGNRISLSNQMVEIIDDIELPSVLSKTDAVTKLSDDPADYTFELDGIIYQLPVSYQKLSEHGWKISGGGYSTDYTESMVLEGRDGTSKVLLSNGNKTIQATFYNPGVETRYLKDCGVSEIWVSRSDDVPIKFAKGIDLNSSGEEIKKAYGVPFDEHEMSILSSVGGYRIPLGYYVEYKFGDNDPNNSFSFKWDNDGDVEVTLYRELYAFDDEEEIRVKAPAYLKDYHAPSKLGDSTTDPIFELDGKLYQMPCPISEFINDGWHIKYFGSAYLPGNEPDSSFLGLNNEFIFLYKNGIELTVQVRNFSEDATLLEHGAAVEVELRSETDYNGENFNPSANFIKFSGGLTAESTLAEFEEKCTAFDGFVITIEDSQTTHKYEYAPPKLGFSIDYRAHEAGHIHEEGYLRANIVTYSCEAWNY